MLLNNTAASIASMLMPIMVTGRYRDDVHRRCSFYCTQHYRLSFQESPEAHVPYQIVNPLSLSLDELRLAIIHLPRVFSPINPFHLFHGASRHGTDAVCSFFSGNVTGKSCPHPAAPLSSSSMESCFQASIVVVS